MMTVVYLLAVIGGLTVACAFVLAAIWAGQELAKRRRPDLPVIVHGDAPIVLEDWRRDRIKARIEAALREGAQS